MENQNKISEQLKAIDDKDAEIAHLNKVVDDLRKSDKDITSKNEQDKKEIEKTHEQKINRFKQLALFIIAVEVLRYFFAY